LANRLICTLPNILDFGIKLVLVIRIERETMNQHVTIILKNKDDFDSLLTALNAGGKRKVYSYTNALKIECYIDQLFLSMAHQYLKAEIIYHNG
jgi:hypothetical protein